MWDGRLMGELPHEMERDVLVMGAEAGAAPQAGRGAAVELR